MPKFAFFIISSVFLSLFTSCNSNVTNNNPKEVAMVLDQWHQAASNADLKSYFNLMTEEAIYIGTDPGERWTRAEFYQFCKPYFDKGKAWDFKPYDREIYFSPDGKTAWFNELLQTWMGVCRGSGVVSYQKDGWKIEHYHLAVTIKNDHIQEFLKIEKDTIKH